MLDELMLFDDILACMVARRNMISVMPSDDTNSFKPEIMQVWDIIKRTMDSQLAVVSEYSQADLGKIDFQLQKYNVLFYVIPDTENALVAVVHALANRGLIAVEMENARREIIRVIEGEEKKKVIATA